MDATRPRIRRLPLLPPGRPPGGPPVGWRRRSGLRAEGGRERFFFFSTDKDFLVSHLVSPHAGFPPLLISRITHHRGGGDQEGGQGGDEAAHDEEEDFFFFFMLFFNGKLPVASTRRAHSGTLT